MQACLDLDGHDCGPLFAPPVKRRAPKRPPDSTRMPGILRRASERQATPPWADKQAIRNVFRHAKEMTLETGVTHSVDHIVPLKHPLVCGLHVAHNMCVLPLLDNLRKSNRTWPQGWGEQLEIV